MHARSTASSRDFAVRYPCMIIFEPGLDEHGPAAFRKKKSHESSHRGGKNERCRTAIAPSPKRRPGIPHASELISEPWVRLSSAGGPGAVDGGSPQCRPHRRSATHRAVTAHGDTIPPLSAQAAAAVRVRAHARRTCDPTTGGYFVARRPIAFPRAGPRDGWRH